jgi:hypothetical protein
MNNYVIIKGTISSEIKEIDMHGILHAYHFKLKVLRSNQSPINREDYDYFNCLLPVKWFKNQIQELNQKLSITIEGELQSVKLNKNDVVFYQAYLIINKILEIKKPIKSDNTQKPDYVKQVKIKEDYFKNFKSNFKAEEDTRGKVLCQCGNLYLSTFEECPICKTNTFDNVKGN